MPYLLNVTNILDINLCFQPRSWVKRFTPPQERRIKVQRFRGWALVVLAQWNQWLRETARSG